MKYLIATFLFMISVSVTAFASGTEGGGAGSGASEDKNSEQRDEKREEQREERRAKLKMNKEKKDNDSKASDDSKK